MEIVYNVIVPIIAALIGGVICGIITYRGIKLSLTKNGQVNSMSKAERNLNINNFIKTQRPELTLKENPYDIKDTLEIYLLPYINPILKDEETIEFQYTNEIFDERYWSEYKVILENTGKIHMDKVLNDRKKANRIREEKQQQFVWDVNSGKIVLNHNYPINSIL